MKALPFPCIRPAQDRVLEALPAMGSILSNNEALRGAIAGCGILRVRVFGRAGTRNGCRGDLPG